MRYHHNLPQCTLSVKNYDRIHINEFKIPESSHHFGSVYKGETINRNIRTHLVRPLYKSVVMFNKNYLVAKGKCQRKKKSIFEKHDFFQLFLQQSIQ
jgi:hypothetical protein